MLQIDRPKTMFVICDKLDINWSFPHFLLENWKKNSVAVNADTSNKDYYVCGYHVNIFMQKVTMLSSVGVELAKTFI